MFNKTKFQRWTLIQIYVWYWMLAFSGESLILNSTILSFQTVCGNQIKSMLHLYYIYLTHHHVWLKIIGTPFIKILLCDFCDISRKYTYTSSLKSGTPKNWEFREILAFSRTYNFLKIGNLRKFWRFLKLQVSLKLGISRIYYFHQIAERIFI